MSKTICPKCGRIADLTTHNCSKGKLKYIKQEELKKRRQEAKAKRERRNQMKKYFKHLEDDESKSTKELRSKRWHYFRQQIILRDGGECQRCKILFHKHVFEPLEVHHIKPRETHPELMYDPDNVVTICKSCNAHLALNGIDFEFKPRNLDDFD